jgi:MFS family permease
MVFSVGPAMLAERGWSLAAAGSATSLVLWIISVASPIGGFVSDRTGKPIALMLSGFVLFAVMLVAAARVDAVIAVFVILGLIGGMAVGPVMSLPARVLEPSVRAVGMGIFFTLFYAFVVAAPIAAGMLATRLGSASAAFDFGAAMLLLCLPAYWLFDRLASRAAAASAR